MLYVTQLTGFGYGSVGDASYGSVSTLLHCNGTNGSTTITDQKSKTYTAFGNAAISTAQSKFGGASLGLDGTGDYITTPDSADFAFGTGDFTIEYWVYHNNTTGTQFHIGKRASSADTAAPFLIGHIGSGQVQYWLTNSAAFDIASGKVLGTLSASTWNHVALVRIGSTFTPYLNGVAGTATTSALGLKVNASALVIGGDTNANQLNGYIDEVRITKGVGRYTAAFTPSTIPFPDNL